MTTEPADPNHFLRSAELLWQAGDRPSRGPKPGLTLAQIVEAAIGVADTDGIDGLSMRRIARELGVGTMSLYRYVPGKPELLDLMLDRVSDISHLIDGAEKRTWREVLETSARATRALYLQHPWLIQINWSRPVFGPNTLASVEYIVSGLAGLALTDQERIMVLISVDSFVTGAARQEIMYTNAAEETGISDEEFWSTQYPILERAMATGDYPAMAELSESAFDTGWDETFEFGLRRLLDGLESFIADRRSA